MFIVGSCCFSRKFELPPNAGVYFQFIILLSGFRGLYPWVLIYTHHPMTVIPLAPRFWFWAEPWQKRSLLDLCLDSLENRSCMFLLLLFLSLFFCFPFFLPLSITKLIRNLRYTCVLLLYDKAVLGVGIPFCLINTAFDWWWHELK